MTSPDVRAVIWDQRLRAPMETLWDGTAFRTLTFDDYFVRHPLPWEGPCVVGPFTIRTFRTRHHVPTALLVEAGGRTLGYSADTAFDPALIEFLSAADTIVHETNYGPAHTSYDDLLTVPAEIRARMRLIHYSDMFDAAASQIRALTEGAVVHI